VYNSRRLKMPSTCTYDNFLSKKFCGVQYTGLKDLLGIDITLRGRVTKCSTGSFEVYVGCKGIDCFLLNNYKLCTSNSDCTATTVCGNMFEGLPFISNNVIDDYDNDTINNPIVTQISVITTPFTALFPFVYYYNIFKDNTMCFKNFSTELYLDAKNIFRSLKGLPKDPSNEFNEYMCTFDTEYMKNFNLTDWAQDQVITDADTITIKGLLAWDIGSNPIEANPSDTDSHGVLFVISSILLLLVFI